MGDLSFYEAAAQVIPILLLALAVETRFLENLRPFAVGSRRPTRRLLLQDAVLLPIAVVAMVAGELAALHVLLDGHASGLEQRLTVVALLVGAFGIATPILNLVTLATRRNLEDFGRRPAQFAEKFGGYTIRVIHVALIGLGVLALGGLAD